ncbi:MAG: DinB family protein [Dehalococcoidia bacterium]
MLDEAMRTLYAYDRWATARLLDVAAQIPAEQFVAPIGAEQRSIRDTLVHMVAAERRWLSWWDGSLPPAEAQRLVLAAHDFPDLPSVRAAWHETDERMQAFAGPLTDADLARILTTGGERAGWSAALWKLMLHLATHGTQHRAEIAAMLTTFGHSPGDLDMTVYYASAGG